MVLDRKPTHPGEVLREDVLKPLSLTVTEAAKKLGVTRKTLSLFESLHNIVYTKFAQHRLQFSAKRFADIVNTF